MVINTLDAAGTAARASSLNVTLYAQLIADIKSIAPAVKGAASVKAEKQVARARTHAAISLGKETGGQDTEVKDLFGVRGRQQSRLLGHQANNCIARQELKKTSATFPNIRAEANR